MAEAVTRWTRNNSKRLIDPGWPSPSQRPGDRGASIAGDLSRPLDQRTYGYLNELSLFTYERDWTRVAEMNVAGEDYEIIRHNAVPSYMTGRVRLSEQKVRPSVVKKNAFAYVLWLRMHDWSGGLHMDTLTAAVSDRKKPVQPLSAMAFGHA